MRSVHVALDLSDADPQKAFEEIAQFARYPDLAPDVRSVVAREDSSDWEVYFRNGVLRWTENDRSDPERLTIAFAQDDGDFEDFEGEWRVVPSATGCRVEFRATFDFGIPSLVGILDPVAERVIKETIARVVKGMFADATVVDDEHLSRALAAAGV